MVGLSPLLLSLSLGYLASTANAHMAIAKRQFNLGDYGGRKPSKTRTIEPPTFTFEPHFPTATPVFPITGHKSGDVDIDDSLEPQDSNIGFGGSESGSQGPVINSQSSGSPPTTAAGVITGSSDDHSNSPGTSILNIHSNSGSTGLNGKGRIASPINRNQGTGTTNTISSGADLLKLLQRSSDSLSADQKPQTRRSRFRSRIGKRQATAGDILSTVGGAAAALPQGPAVPSESLPAPAASSPTTASG